MDDATQLELLERTLNEIDALEAIYGGEGDDESCFVVISTTELEKARRIIEEADETASIPQLEVEIKASDSETKSIHSLRCRLPPGYPVVPAKASAWIEGLPRTQREALSARLSENAKSMSGFESVMGLVDDLKELALAFVASEKVADETIKDPSLGSQKSYPADRSIGRRWIWVHHIKDASRRKSILQEARELELGGYLKSGYPGIIVIEGDRSACDLFVAWVKGNKSRPGGFGRNWGHHVRGEINGPVDDRRLPLMFTELEDLAFLGSLCKDHGLEDEFLEYVMQHKGNGN
jgi:hypothetical protein